MAAPLASNSLAGTAPDTSDSSPNDPLSRSSIPTPAAPAREPARPVRFGWLKSLLGMRGQGSSLREALEEMIEEHEDRTVDFDPEEKTLLQNVLHFGETTVSEIMVPLADILAVPDHAPFEEIKRMVIESRHTRIPIYHETIDDIKGFLHTKDLIQVMSSHATFDLPAILRPMLFVPPFMRILELLLEMKRSRLHMAIVVDEFGGTRGLVTLEDLFEELVGDIHDEHDTEEDIAIHPEFNEEGMMEADARLRLDDLDEADAHILRPDSEEEEYETLGGLAFYHLGRVPDTGEKILLPRGWRMEILEADERRVLRVRLQRPGSGDSAEMAAE